MQNYVKLFKRLLLFYFYNKFSSCFFINCLSIIHSFFKRRFLLDAFNIILKILYRQVNFLLFCMIENWKIFCLVSMHHLNSMMFSYSLGRLKTKKNF